MISRIHDRLGTAGFVLSIVALVVALGGGAYAASGGLTGKQKKEVEKIAKKYAGKPGPEGKQGPAGANGKDGGNGQNGAAGKDGATGPQGEPGPPGAKGDQGDPGAAGNPWTPDNALPSKATETGAWYFVSKGEEPQILPIGFAIPLSAADAEAVTVEFRSKIQGPSEDCPGNSEKPEAVPGVLCFYTSPFETSRIGGPRAAYKPLSKEKIEALELAGEPGEEEGVVPAGTYLYFSEVPAGQTMGGTFALTAPLSGP